MSARLSRVSQTAAAIGRGLEPTIVDRPMNARDSADSPDRSRLSLLLLPPNYPHDRAQWFGAQNERCALALRPLVRHVEVLTPKPYAPPMVRFNARWTAYRAIPGRHVRSGIRVHRPSYPVIPRVLQGFWQGWPAFVFSRHLACSLHLGGSFDAILSFDLAATGGLAWRLSSLLGIPACGWATGSDIRSNPDSRVGRSVRESLQKLDMVFYQSRELMALGARLLGMHPSALPTERHIVQSRGVAQPEASPAGDVRHVVRARLGVSSDDVVVLYLGRIVREKGLFGLVEGFSQWAKQRTNLVLMLVGSIPGYDDARELQKKMQSVAPGARILLLPACAPASIWDYFSAADIFAFPSFREGMPNSLLEAMIAGLPAVAFSIDAVREITQHGRGLIEVEPNDFPKFGEALLALAADPLLRRKVGEQGRAVVREHFSVERGMRSVVHQIERLLVR
jgi:glycosyltransferase involved in cell wall biosynthesis